MTNYLDPTDILRIHHALVEFFATDGDPIVPPGTRDDTLLHSACGRPRTSLGGHEKYSAVQEKAAALLHSLIMNHPFHNGNKRTALASMVTFLDSNGRILTATDDELFDLVTGVADNRRPKAQEPGTPDEFVEEIAQWINERTHVAPDRPREMATNEFLAQCRGYGARVSKTADGRSWSIMGLNGAGTVRFNTHTRVLTGMVVKRYVQKLGLSESSAGLKLQEFQSGIGDAQPVIIRLKAVLRRLAYA